MKLELKHVETTLEAAGYRLGRVPMFDQCQDIFFKSVKDRTARYYQIEVLCYWGTKFPDEEYTGGIMVRMHNSKPWFIFEQHGFKDANADTIALWENRCALFFESMGCEPYERFDVSPTLSGDPSNEDSRQ